MKIMIRALTVVTMLVSCNRNNGDTHQPSAEKSQADTTTNDIAAEENWQDIESDQALVATALMAAPEESREASTVIGYNVAGEFVTLKEGSNEFICLADDPRKEGFNAACYHKDLEPFMARGRELKKEGKSFQEIFDIRESEAKSGNLTMPKSGATLHIYYSEKAQYNPETNEVADGNYRYVVYIPWATSESTGLPETPASPNHPWIMDPGTHRAHIMITPLQNDEKE